MIDEYIPKKFCRELVLAKRNSLQLGMYMACVLGIKPFMDDWISVERMADFRKACKGYGLYIKEDIIFRDADKDRISDAVVGRDVITSTSGFGLPLGTRGNGSVHVFLSKDKRLLKEGMWYPAVIKNRVVFQPHADSLGYGDVLGYPECCVRFFRKYNDWNKYSYLYEVFKNTKGKPSFLCNPLLKYVIFSYIFHMPCCYDCANTKVMAGKLRQEIRRREPDFVTMTDYYLKMPFLVFYEMKAYAFEGLLKNNHIRYKSHFFLLPDKTKDLYGRILRKADALKLDGMDITLYKGNRYVGDINVTSHGFAPEIPFLIQFS